MRDAHDKGIPVPSVVELSASDSPENRIKHVILSMTKYQPLERMPLGQVQKELQTILGIYLLE